MCKLFSCLVCCKDVKEEDTPDNIFDIYFKGNVNGCSLCSKCFNEAVKYTKEFSSCELCGNYAECYETIILHKITNTEYKWYHDYCYNPPRGRVYNVT
jgi:hypothetical protein